MQAAQTVTMQDPVVHVVLEMRPEAPPEQFNFQPVIERLRVIYLEHINCNDELSLQIQEVAERFILEEANQAGDVIKMAQDCRDQFAKILFNDFDQATLEVPVVVRDWKFEEWQLHDYVSLDKFFGQRQVALSPFDNMPFPEQLPNHEFAQAIIDLLKTIPQVLQEVNAPIVAANDQFMLAVVLQGAGDGKIARQNVENFAPQDNFMVAWQRYDMWKKLARASVQEKKSREFIAQLEIDSAARRLENENQLQRIINEEAQRMLAYFAERQQEVDEHLQEAEQAREEIGKLKAQLDAATEKIAKLRSDLSSQEKRSNDLQQQLYVEQANYARLAQQVQELRNRIRRKNWFQRIFG